MQQRAGVSTVLLVIFIKTEHKRLNHQVSKSVGSCGKHIGDSGVHVFIITRVGGKLLGNKFWTNNVEQVVSEGENLKNIKEAELIGARKDIPLPQAFMQDFFPHSNLEVSTHDLAGLLVESLSVPVRIEICQSTCQTVVLTQHQCV